MQSSPANEPNGQPRGELGDELERLRGELAEMEDRYLRARAELENYRRRTERDFDQRVTAQGDDLLRSWLEIVDSLERGAALEAGPDDLAPVLLDQVRSMLARHGVTRLGEVGDAFDPELHEAIAVVPGTTESAGTIADVVRPGYAAGGRVVRPAQVAVAGRAGDGD